MEYFTIEQSEMLNTVMMLKDNGENHAALLVEDTSKDIALDWETIIGLAVNGDLRAFIGAEDGVKAYAVFMVGKNILYRNTMEATNIVLFVDPESRDKTDEFLVFCEDELKGMGFDEVQYMLRSGLLGRYLKIKGYKDEYKLWSKAL